MLRSRQGTPRKEGRKEAYHQRTGTTSKKTTAISPERGDGARMFRRKIARQYHNNCYNCYHVRHPTMCTMNFDVGRVYHLATLCIVKSMPSLHQIYTYIYAMVSPLPCCGVMICSKCPLIIPGRRYRLPGRGFFRPFVQKALRRPSKRLT